MLSYHRSHALSEADGKYQSDHDDGIGKRDSCQLSSAQMSHHDVVRQLHQYLPCLRNHHGESHFQVSFIERYVFLKSHKLSTVVK